MRNFKKGIDLLKQSAALDYAKAQVLLGTMLHAGTDVPRDSKRAKAWARRAAEQDEPKGAALLGVLLAQQQRYGEAARWLRKASDKSIFAATGMLGWLYLSGNGVEQDIVRAEKLIRRAAEAKTSTAQFLLGAMYLEGRGVPQDCALARDWLERSAKQDNARAINLLTNLDIGAGPCGGTV